MTKKAIIDMLKAVSRIEGYVFAVNKNEYCVDQIDILVNTLTAELDTLSEGTMTMDDIRQAYADGHNDCYNQLTKGIPA